MGRPQGRPDNAAARQTPHLDPARTQHFAGQDTLTVQGANQHGCQERVLSRDTYAQIYEVFILFPVTSQTPDEAPQAQAAPA